MGGSFLCWFYVLWIIFSAVIKNKILGVEEKDFQEEIKNGVCLVDFYASWCGPCQKYAPVMDKAKAFYGNQVEFYKIDVDENSDLCEIFNVMSVPTTIIIYNSEGYYYESTGLLTLAQLREGINKALKENR